MSQYVRYGVPVFSRASRTTVSMLVAGLAVGSADITGVAALNVAPPSIAASGAETFTGAAALTVGQPTISASGTLTISGTATLAVAQPTIAASGALEFAGAAALTVPQPSIAGSGTTDALASIPDLVMAGTAAQVRRGIWRPLKPRLEVSYLPSALTPTEGFSGTAALAVAQPTISGAGTISGVAAGIPDLLMGGTTAQVRRAARVYSAEQFLAAPIVTFAGSVSEAISGSATLVVAAPAISASGGEAFSGTAALTVPSPTISASGSIIVAGTATLTVGQPTISASGTVGAIVGVGTLSVSQPNIAAVGSEAFTGTAAVLVPSSTIAASGLVLAPVTGNAALTVPVPTITASGPLAGEHVLRVEELSAYSLRVTEEGWPLYRVADLGRNRLDVEDV